MNIHTYLLVKDSRKSDLIAICKILVHNTVDTESKKKQQYYCRFKLEFYPVFSYLRQMIDLCIWEGSNEGITVLQDQKKSPFKNFHINL